MLLGIADGQPRPFRNHASLTLEFKIRDLRETLRRMGLRFPEHGGEGGVLPASSKLVLALPLTHKPRSGDCSVES